MLSTLTVVPTLILLTWLWPRIREPMAEDNAVVASAS
jgi:hypothetical protein